MEAEVRYKHPQDRDEAYANGATKLVNAYMKGNTLIPAHYRKPMKSRTNSKKVGLNLPPEVEKKQVKRAQSKRQKTRPTSETITFSMNGATISVTGGNVSVSISTDGTVTVKP